MSVSIVFVRAVVAELQQRGLDGQQLLRDCQIDSARLDDIHEILQPDDMERITRHAVEITGDPSLGLAVGWAQAESSLQVYGHLLRTQATVRDAFDAHMRYSAMIATGPRWNLTEEGDFAHFSLMSFLRPSPMRRFMMEYAITMTMGLCRAFFPRLSAGALSSYAVHFQHEEPSYAERYKLYFRCPIEFARPANAIIFPRAILDRRQAHADLTMDRMLREAAERILQGQAREHQLHERIRLLLRHCMEVQQINSERVARAFGITLRTMRRTLANEGYALSTLVDEARCRVACDALLREELSLPDVAAIAGYSETSAFFRAFKRWTGQTPGEFRRGAEPPKTSDSDELVRRS